MARTTIKTMLLVATMPPVSAWLLLSALMALMLAVPILLLLRLPRLMMGSMKK